MNLQDIYQVTIVDNTNSLDTRPVKHIGALLDNNLNSGVRIGLRTERNNRVSQHTVNIFIESEFNSERIIVLEGTLVGIGVIRGNMCIEVAANQLNEEYGGKHSNMSA